MRNGGGDQVFRAEENSTKNALRVVIAGLAAPAFADLALATSKNCMAATRSTKVLGPSFKDVAAKYKDDKAPSTCCRQDHQGGSGVGACLLPANTRSARRSHELAAWVLTK